MYAIQLPLSLYNFKMIDICWNNSWVHETQVILLLTQSTQESLTNARITVDLEPNLIQCCGRWVMNHRIKQVLHACLYYPHTTFHQGFTRSNVLSSNTPAQSHMMLFLICIYTVITVFCIYLHLHFHPFINFLFSC